MTSNRAVVLGGGIQGCLVALMLARRGVRVTLVDQRARLLDAASLNYEGRIHTGMLYAMDKSFATADRMARDAVSFAPAIEHLIGRPLDWSALKMRDSRYYVHKNSNLSVGELQPFWRRIETVFAEAFEDPAMHYLGARPRKMFEETDIPENAKPGMVLAAFDTCEGFVDQTILNGLIKDEIVRSPLIELCLGSCVEGVERHGTGALRVRCHSAGQQTTLSGAYVINCLWEERHRFDTQMGLPARKADESLRLKFSMLVKNTAFFRETGSFILTHGAYGSAVLRDGDPYAFVTWYPACCDGMIAAQDLPQAWQRLLAGDIPQARKDRLVRENINGFRQIFPDFPSLTPIKIKAGIIVAHGRTDIDKPGSGLHARDEAPIASCGDYHSVATGKYTSAGRNALQLEQRIFA